MTKSKAILIQQATGAHTQMLDLTGARHEAYAARHDLTFWSVRGDVQFERATHWNKIRLVQSALALGYELVVWLDADTLIVRPEEDLRDALPDGPPIGLCRHPQPWQGQSHHHNSGVIFVRNTPLARRFFDEVWTAGPVNHPWHEQVRVMEVMENIPDAVQPLDDRWNSSEGITPRADAVIRAWHGFGLGALPHLYAALRATGPVAGLEHRCQFIHRDNARARAEKFNAALPAGPGNFQGQGLVICGGGVRYFTCAWVCIQRLRRLGCTLPIQLWHLGPEELDATMAALVAPFGVTCIDALEVRKQHPARILNGWELKAYAILHSPFQEVLLLDADNVAVVNPEFLFETPEYRETGAIFWPDYGRLAPTRDIWEICGIPWRDEPEFESGQIVVDKNKCWRPLSLCMWYNEHSDFFYNHIHGDKETFHLAWRKLDQPYAMPDFPIHALEDVMCQHDFQGRRIFQHRNLDKWELSGNNKTIAGFLHEAECLEYLADLRRQWSGTIRR